jgi:hypothetical protein
MEGLITDEMRGLGRGGYTFEEVEEAGTRLAQSKDSPWV